MRRKNAHGLLPPLVLLALAAALVTAQDTPRPSAPIGALSGQLRLGMPRAQVLKALGSPCSCYVGDTGRHIEDCALAHRLHDNVWDVYSRKTAANEYEIRVRYAADQRLSRLHPTLRITGLWFVLDRPLVLESLLGDIPEARELCRSGCEIDVENRRSSPHIVVYPVSPTMEETEFATVAAGDKQGNAHWRPAVIAYCENWQPYSKRAPEWLSDKIEEFQLRPHDPNFERELARKSVFPDPPLELGKWSPAGVLDKREIE